MTTHTEILPGIIAVEIPKDSSDHWVINNNTEKVGLNWYIENKSFGEEGNTWSEGVDLPPGEWNFIFSTNHLTEENAKKVVENVIYDVPPHPSNDMQGDWRTAWRDYEGTEDTGYSEHPFVHSAIESFNSLLRSHSLDIEKNYAILKNKLL